MHSLTLCRERLSRILNLLDRNAGVLSIGDFLRSFTVFDWELEQAAALGWVEIVTTKPATGRPSCIVRRVSQTEVTKLPPWLSQIEKSISCRHHNFALYSVCWAVRGGSKRFFYMPPLRSAYQKAFPGARKRRAAAASMGRLLRPSARQSGPPVVLCLRQRRNPRTAQMPETASAIRQSLREAENWREKFDPRY